MRQEGLHVGYYGAMANNAYVAAKCANHLGYKATYIHDVTDNFPFSQPVWEDKDLTVPYDDIYNRIWTRADWEKVESEKGWKPAQWFVYPDVAAQKDSFLGFIKRKKLSLKSILSYLYMRRSSYRFAVVAEMQKQQALFVCGVEAEILAWCSDIPYVIWPHGGDIRMAAGLIAFNGKGLRSLLSYWASRLYLALAYKEALWVGTHDSKGIAGEMGDVNIDLELFPMPMPDRGRAADRHTRTLLLFDVMKELDVKIPEADFYFFVPSRVNFFWKKTHLLKDAIRKYGIRGKCHFIFAGWGEDYAKMKDMVEGCSVSFLPSAVSKTLVFKLFQSVDVVIDQFYLGAYGTAAVEAMSCNVPVLMYIQDDSFEKRGWSPPPVINCRDEKDVVEKIEAIVSKNYNLEEDAENLHQWFLRVHDERVVIPEFYKKLEERISSLRNNSNYDRKDGLQ